MKEHPSFKVPDDINAKVWRYLDFTRYVSLLSTSSLFFVRADMFEDKFEGAATKIDIEAKAEINTAIGIPFVHLEEMSHLDHLTNKSIRKMTGICSWQLSDYESAAMWKIYLKSQNGVAIQSTYKKLADSFDSYIDNTIFTGLVNYTDYDTEEIPGIRNNLFNRFLHKRKSFEFEKEVRSIFFQWPIDTPGNTFALTKDNVETYYETIEGKGKNVLVSLNELIESIVVSPYSADWFINLVREITKKYNYDFPVYKSRLADSPSF